MAARVTVSLDEDVAAEIQKTADRNGRSLDEAVNDSLRSSIRPRLPGQALGPLNFPAKALHALPGINLDNIEELLDYAEGPARR